jgi:ATP-dependent DNA helicase RecQ
VCLDGPVRLPDASPRPPIGTYVQTRDVLALAREHPAVLGEARQQARFLCGLGSPGLTTARLSRHPLFGTLANHRFAEVLAWCGSLH